MPPRTFLKGDGFHPLGCAINNGKNIIKTITVLQWDHQINMKMRKTPLRDGDREGDQACVAVDLAPRAGQTTAGSGGDVAGKTAPYKPR
jgi:hypothetical protein